MDREWLGGALAAGRSIESIAAEVGKDPSTVGYWVRKHGLRSTHAERHAPRGGIERETLVALVLQDLTTRQIAEHLDCSQSTVRYWLRLHDLKTTRAARRKVEPGPDRPKRVVARCPEHGEVEHGLRAEGGYRCLKCRSASVAAWRRRLKRRMIAEFGGCCAICGYDRCAAVLHFHHRNPNQKRFGIGSRGLGRSIESIREEARKCVILCANCHGEVETGYISLADGAGWQIGNATHC